VEVKLSGGKIFISNFDYLYFVELHNWYCSKDYVTTTVSINWGIKCNNTSGVLEFIIIRKMVFGLPLGRTWMVIGALNC